MWPALAAFLFGFLAGFVMLRLGRNTPLAQWERRLLVPLGWALTAASLTLAVALVGWAALTAGDGSTHASDPVRTSGTPLNSNR
jgi:hypothetical protein